ncbi:GDP-mannose pyrophosphatase NudK [Variibacter gotjawalensis]|uniref:GDP-mannose pyrophosphatase n=1 Tax=Variibacter gotjawalensis TaxID=1333996 RepID=A0A0S3PTP4_9BRAD|nr:NUDIX hydrolase [Variibacter gotjawalensis]NIK49582.1 nudix-type nucleoside diphosphatase (YffH/AdpP family) [Variibacter gotjawalensis]RZS45593.1 nudix-type nucleoside diphosphatase (YffH/AdpP family) [Variibacter gotjawalensis]BAT59266.1 GDP-mannose pyrophosphatase NudK [Variibacter gotjawalensis]
MKLLEMKTVYEGWTKLSVGRFRADDGVEFGREIEDHGSAVGVMPYDAERRCAILVRQFRAPVFARSGGMSLLEAAAGILDEDDPEACARREAMEETGLKLGTLEFVSEVVTAPGISTETMHLYLAPYTEADRVAAGGGLVDEHERIEVIEMPLTELAAMADNGTLTDLKTLALVQTLRLRKPQLFA